VLGGSGGGRLEVIRQPLLLLAVPARGRLLDGWVTVRVAVGVALLGGPKSIFWPRWCAHAGDSAPTAGEERAARAALSDRGRLV
jgi:hypothetical protein